MREVKLPARNRAGLRLVIASQQRVVWLHDPVEGKNILIPVTNLYNELMLEKRIRDPQIALDHRHMFAPDNRFSDKEIAAAFVRYNVLYHKIGVELFDVPATPARSFWAAMFKRRTH